MGGMKLHRLNSHSRKQNTNQGCTQESVEGYQGRHASALAEEVDGQEIKTNCLHSFRAFRTSADYIPLVQGDINSHPGDNADYLGRERN